MDNRTPMAVGCFRLDDRHGRDVAAVIAKMTYEVSARGEVRIAIPKAPIRTSDVPHRAEDIPRLGLRGASIRYPSDFVEERPGTSVVLVATAHPQGEVTHQDVSLRVGKKPRELLRIVRVHGPRVFQSTLRGVVPGPAWRLSPTPIVYELAYGGVDDADPANPMIEPRNPVGFGVARSRAALVGKPAPQIEDLVAPSDARHPAPAGFGAVSPTWSPRAGWQGTRDEAWLRERAPVRPVDFDPRFHCPAPPDQWMAEPLDEDAPVQVLGATPEGRWAFELPAYRPLFRSTIRGQRKEHPTHLDTLLFDADARRVELSWRVAIPLPRKADFLESVVIHSAQALPKGMLEDLTRRLNERSAHEHATG